MPLCFALLLCACTRLGSHASVPTPHRLGPALFSFQNRMGAFAFSSWVFLAAFYREAVRRMALEARLSEMERSGALRCAVLCCAVTCNAGAHIGGMCELLACADAAPCDRLHG